MSKKLKTAIIVCLSIELILCLFIFKGFKTINAIGNGSNKNIVNKGDKNNNKPVKPTEIKDKPEIKGENVSVEDTVEKEKQEQVHNINYNIHNGIQKESIDKTKKVCYLTFDDGPSHNTEKILDTLKKYDIKATFFVIGNNTEYGKEMYRRIVAEGHTLGNHSYSHKYSSIYQSLDTYKKDAERLEKLLDETVGVRPVVMRFPGGSNNHVSRKYSKNKEYMSVLSTDMVNEGYEYYDWNVSAEDCVSGVKPKAQIIKSVIDGAKDRRRAVILFHDGAARTTTAEALPEIIEELKKMGFEFKPLTETSPSLKFKN